MSNCSKHKKDVCGISNMKELAEMIGDLHYDALSKLLFELGMKFHADANKDRKGGRAKLSRKLMEAYMNTHEAHCCISDAWKISKPFMEVQLSEPKVEK